MRLGASELRSGAPAADCAGPSPGGRRRPSALVDRGPSWPRDRIASDVHDLQCNLPDSRRGVRHRSATTRTGGAVDAVVVGFDRRFRINA